MASPGRKALLSDLTCLSPLCAQCGLPSQFRWGQGDWEVLDEDGDEEETTAEAERPAAAAARGGEAGPSSRVSSEAARPRPKAPPRPMEDALRELEPWWKVRQRESASRGGRVDY